MKPNISVIICTHNPRPNYFERVLRSLQNQTFPKEQWELLLIDNASDRPLALDIDLSWHPLARHIREDKLGLTHARLCGIRAFQADLIVFVDDDNVLNEDYLEQAWKISDQFPMIGAWGGQTIPDFDVAPAEWTRPFWANLGIREFDSNQCSNLPLWETTPIGAGLCIRRAVVEKYVDLVTNDLRRAKLGRNGNLLLCCEDLDLVYTAHDLGFETGLFADLKLLHLMPVNRLEERYLLRLIEGNAYSTIMLDFIRGKLPSVLSWQKKLRLAMPWLVSPKMLFRSARERKFSRAKLRGWMLAMQEIMNSDRSVLDAG